MGEIVSLNQYRERKEQGIAREDIPERLAEIALELLHLQSEKNRLERLLLQSE